MTIRELIESYRQTSGDQTRREDARHAQWWVQRIGQSPVSALTITLVLETLDRLAAHGRSPSTVAFYLRFLRRVCAWGALVSYLPADPCSGMDLPRERTPQWRFLTEEEESRLCVALGPPYALWVKFAISTGLTQSEQFTLRWRDVDLDRAGILLPHRTGAVSALQLAPPAVAILRQLRQLQAPSLWVFPDPKNPSRSVNIHAFYVGRWGKAVHEADIPWCAWKDLRHTCGVRLARQGHRVDDIVRLMRQRENRYAYTYRALAAGRRIEPKASAPPLRPVFPDLSPGELQAVMLRDPRQHPLSFGEAARLYAVHHLRNRPARQNFDRVYRQFWQPWTDRPLESLTRKEIRGWYLELAHTPGHANKALTFLRSLYNWVLDLELVTATNPAARIRRFHMPPRERFLSLDELHRLMTGLPHLSLKFRAYLLLLLFTGSRRSEARLIRWADIDEQTRLWRKGRTKNGTSQLVPLPVQVLQVLQSLPRTNEWVFPGDNGRPWSAASVEKTWGIFRRRIGLDDVRLHDLRRTCASYLAIQGENLPTIQNVLNHQSLTPTSIYARLNVKAVDRALQDQADRIWRLIDQPAVPVMEFPSMKALPDRVAIQ